MEPWDSHLLTGIFKGYLMVIWYPMCAPMAENCQDPIMMDDRQQVVVNCDLSVYQLNDSHEPEENNRKKCELRTSRRMVFIRNRLL